MAVFPPHPDLIIGNTSLNSCESLKILGVMFDSKFTFERHIRSIWLLKRLVCSRNLLGSFGLRVSYWDVYYFILPCLEYCSTVWSSAMDSHLKLLDKNCRACTFLIPNLTISLQHRHSISPLCMLYKIFHNLLHPLHFEIPYLFYPRRVPRGSLNVNSIFFSPLGFNTSQCSRCFIPATTKLWNDLLSMTVEAGELQKF